MRRVPSDPPLPAGLPSSAPALAAQLAQTLAVARGLVLGGRRVDLTGVEEGVGVLCAKTLDLGSRDARTMLPLLREIMAQLESLSEALRPEPPR